MTAKVNNPGFHVVPAVLVFFISDMSQRLPASRPGLSVGIRKSGTWWLDISFPGCFGELSLAWLIRLMHTLLGAMLNHVFNRNEAEVGYSSSSAGF